MDANGIDVVESRDERSDEGNTSNDGFESFLAALASSPPPYRPPRLQPGSVFDDRYRVERELGRGGMGTVYLAEDLELRRRVALKVAAGRRAEVELVRLQQEAKLMAQLSHPGIVTVFEAKAIGDGLYLALEFVPGGTLRDWFDLERRGWREVVGMFIRVAEALHAAHTSGVVHRDFKPHNVLLGLDRTPRIADFGLARSLETSTSLTASTLEDLELTIPGTVMGTPAYMSPEQADGQEATPASDQFSFFVALYEGICGERPFLGPTLPAVMKAVEAGPPKAPPGMPRKLAALVRRGLAWDPKDRHRDMAIIEAELRNIFTAKRRHIRNAALSAGAVVAAGLGFLSAPQAAIPCAPDDVSASVDRIWTDSVRRATRARSGTPVAEQLDAYRDALVVERVSACEAHQRGQSLSDEDFALTSACLDRAEARLGGFVDDLQAASALAPGRGVHEMLRPPVECQDRNALRSIENAYAQTSHLGSAAQERAALHGLRLLTRATLQQHRGEDISEDLDEIEALARANGLANVEGVALWLRASAEPDLDAQEALLDRIAEIAGKTHYVHLHAYLARGRSQLALARGDLDLANVHLQHAELLAQLQVHSETTWARVERELLRLRLQIAGGEQAASITALRVLLDEIPWDSPWALQAQSLLATALLDSGQFAEADAAFSRALAHPSRSSQRTLALRINQAWGRLEVGEAREAMRMFDAAMAEADEDDAAAADSRAPIGLGRAKAAWLLDDLDGAQREAAAVEALLTAQDPQHPHLGNVFDLYAQIEQARGNWDGAVEQGKRTLSHWDSVYGPRSANAGRTLAALVDPLRELGRTHKAIEVARVSIAVLEEQDRPAHEVAVARFALAQLLEGSEAAQALATASRDCAGVEWAGCAPILAHNR